MKPFLASLLIMCILLTGCGQGYQKEHGRWAWVSWNEGNGRQVEFLNGVEDSSFHVLSPPEYAADQKCVYHRSVKIKNADPATFRRIDRSYWRDAKHVFLDDIEIPGADPETFQLLPKYRWGRDKHDVYAMTSALHVRDISSFTLLEGVWAKDSKAYYAGGGLLQYTTVPCDYTSFKVLNGSYARDRTRGYWQGVPIEGSDSASFEATSEFSARDRYGVYSGPRRQ
jgi:hypothetical protein